MMYDYTFTLHNSGNQVLRGVESYVLLKLCSAIGPNLFY